MADVVDQGASTATPDGGAPAGVTETALGGSAPAPTNPDGTPTTPAQTTPADAPVGAPEKYDLKAPEGTTFDPEVMTKYEALFREANLTNEAAQKLVDAYSAEAKAKDVDVVAQIVKQHDEWHTALKADPELGGLNLAETTKNAQSAIARFGSPALREFLRTNPVGSHPELVRFANNIGKAMAEDTVVLGKSTSTEVDAARALFPSMKS